jgi:hypothetical protein
VKPDPSKLWYTRYVTSQLRRIFRWSPEKRRALAGASVKGSRPAIYKCALCLKFCIKSDVHVDHIQPVVDPEVGFVDWNTLIERLYCDASGLRVLCVACHKDVTKKQNAVRRKFKK